MGSRESRVFRMEASDTLLSDDDRFWKLGMLYRNPNDASLFLPQRSGIGWTVNWGRPAVWAMVAAFVLLVPAFIAICVVMVKGNVGQRFPIGKATGARCACGCAGWLVCWQQRMCR